MTIVLRYARRIWNKLLRRRYVGTRITVVTDDSTILKREDIYSSVHCKQCGAKTPGYDVYCKDCRP